MKPYYSFPPFKPQYYFPISYKNYSLLSVIYQPYTCLGKVSWWLWNNIAPVRSMFIKRDIDHFLPQKIIAESIGKNAVLVFNLGSPGPEQKITAVGINNEIPFFIKIAQTVLTINNLANEVFILQQLYDKDFVPKIIKYHVTTNYIYLQTNFLKGKRYELTIMNDSVLSIILKIASLKINTRIRINDKLTCFAHGDFCPWNIIENNGELKIFDWELAGTYPLGYDIFTFIFQTSFLLTPKKKIEDIILENKDYIETFFKQFGIKEWNCFLVTFAENKLDIETRKNNTRLVPQLSKLLAYAKKT